MARKKLNDEERYQMLKKTGGKGSAKDQAWKARRERIMSSVKKKKKLSMSQRQSMLRETGGTGTAKDQAFRKAADKAAGKEEKLGIIDTVNANRARWRYDQKKNPGSLVNKMKRGWERAKPVESFKKTARTVTGVRSLDEASKLGQKIIKGTAENIAENLQYIKDNRLTPKGSLKNALPKAGAKAELRRKKLQNAIKKNELKIKALKKKKKPLKPKFTRYA